MVARTGSSGRLWLCLRKISQARRFPLRMGDEPDAPEGSGRHADAGPRPPSRVAGVVSGAEFAGIGIQFALTILVFVFAGVWLDRRLGTSPWLLLTFVFVGAGGGIYSMYRRVTAAQRRSQGGGARTQSGGRTGEGT